MGRVGFETSLPARPYFYSTHCSEGLRLFELALVLVRLYHVASLIVNPNRSIMRATVKTLSF